ncbi:MAG: hypothetical protein KC776_23860 [Myxococcales bacterium]|nr:hypothetical protein [Myxococcales bacterium]MCB9580380.1 hypothetical protein [Polyangiaceae bacterium]
MKLSRLEAYLEALPNGLSSYPTYTQKAAVYRQLVGNLPRLPALDALPAELRALVNEPLPVSGWLTEARANALYLALADVRGVSDAQFVDEFYSVNRGVLSSPLYSVLFLVLSPQRLVRGAATRWGSFHRGIRLSIKAQPKQTTVRMEYPAELLPEILARAYVTAFQAAVELAGGKHVSFNVAEYTPAHTVFDGSWD